MLIRRPMFPEDHEPCRDSQQFHSQDDNCEEQAENRPGDSDQEGRNE